MKLLHANAHKFTFLAAGIATFLFSVTEMRSEDMIEQAYTTESLSEALDSMALPPDAPGLAIAVVSRGTLVSAAKGPADTEGRVMTPDWPVRIASMTKPVVAAAVLRLWEDGRLDLDAPLADLISVDHDAMLRTGGYDTQAITPRHLLMHASGMNDHAEAPAYLDAVFGNPAHIWTRTEQIKVLIEETTPVGLPGAQFHYSDTGYILLGELVERITGDPLGRAVRQLTGWEAHGLGAVQWEGDTASGEPVRAHQWLNGMDVTGIHGSVDAFGGGGIIASVEQTARLYDALLSGAVFERNETLELMLTAPGAPKGSPYRMGLFADTSFETTAYRHGGFWGLDAIAIPERQLVIVGLTLEQANLPALRVLVDGLARRTTP